MTEYYPDGLRGGDKKEEAMKALKQRPLLVIFFMDGCPACEGTHDAWKEAKEKTDIPMIAIESSATPEGEATSGFPTIKYQSKDGKDTVVTGSKKTGDELLDAVKAPKKSSGGRRRRLRSRRNVNRRGGRKSRHRTLSSYVSF